MQQSLLWSRSSFVAVTIAMLLSGAAVAQASEMVQVPSPNGTMVTEVDLPAGNGPFPWSYSLMAAMAIRSVGPGLPIPSMATSCPTGSVAVMRL